MTSNNTFSFTRLGLLLRQNIAHNYRLLVLGAIAFCGAVFLLLLFIQASTGFDDLTMDTFNGMFVAIFFTGAVLSAGTAFPAFRTKEKAVAFLLIPVSAAEKFAAEFLFRVVLFAIAVPALYWMVFGLENTVVSLFVRDYQVSMDGIPGISTPNDDVHPVVWFTFFCSMILSVFIIPFMGSTIFTKAPLIKTLFVLAILVFFNVFVVYFFAEVLDFKQYKPDGSILFMDEPSDVLNAATVFSLLLNAGMLAVTYFKIKEKEA